MNNPIPLLLNLNSDLDTEKKVFSSGLDFYSNELMTEQIEIESDAKLKQRLSFYMNWCLKNNKAYYFDLIAYDLSSKSPVKIRRSSIHMIELNKFVIAFGAAISFAESEMAKGLGLLDSVSDPVLVCEAEPLELPGPRIIYCNKAYESDSGYSKNEILGSTPRILHGIETEEEARKNIREALKAWSSFRQNITNYKKNGDKFLVELNINPIKDEAGWWSYWVSYQRDITKKMNEQEMLIIQAKLASIGELAAGIGHEINNPLTIAIGKLEKLKPLLSQDTEKIFSSIEHAHMRIMRITDGLRTFSRTGKNEEVFNLDLILEHNISFVQDIYQTAGVDLKYIKSVEDEVFIKADRNQIQQVLMNLFANAKDATEGFKERKVVVTLKTENNTAKVSVKDNGKGIDPTIRSKIFDSFFSTKDLGKGTGLGLTISKKIISSFGGTIHFTSDINGTEFFVSFPISSNQRENNDGIVQTNKSLARNLSVLVVDDEEGIREILDESFKTIGCRYKIVNNGKEALEEFLRDDSYELILSDIKMPVMNGVELLLEIRKLKGHKRPYFIFMSGGTSADFKEDLDFQGFLSKPFTIDQIIATIHSVVV